MPTNTKVSSSIPDGVPLHFYSVPTYSTINIIQLESGSNGLSKDYRNPMRIAII